MPAVTSEQLSDSSAPLDSPSARSVAAPFVNRSIDDDGSETVEGVLTDGTLVSLAAAQTSGASLHLLEFDIQSIGTLAGSFFISSFSGEGAEGGDPATFTATFQSGGAVTLT